MPCFQRGTTHKMRNKIIAISGLLGIVLLLWIIRMGSGEKTVDNIMKKVTSISSGGFSIDKNTPGYETFRELISGCPFKDCIPSIDEPKFEGIKKADDWLEDDNVVFVLSYKNEVRAYPQRILNRHEIVNDEVGGTPVAITFCPLCGSALAFERTLENEVLEFGVSGKLHNSDLVMYDRQTESLWQQITGEAIVGKLIGKKLSQISMGTMLWSQFKETYDKGQILSRNTGRSKSTYDIYPYGNYEEDASVTFPVEGGVDTTIHPKTVVFGIEVGGGSKAYPISKLEKELTIRDRVGGVSVEIRYDGGNVNARRLDNGSKLAETRLFWFAWKAFYPNTELY